MATQTRQADTPRQHIPVRPEDLVKMALNKAIRYRTSPVQSRQMWQAHIKLLTVLVREVGSHYVTLPQSVRVALEDFLNE